MSFAIIDDKVLPVFIGQKGGQILPLPFLEGYFVCRHLKSYWKVLIDYVF